VFKGTPSKSDLSSCLPRGSLEVTVEVIGHQRGEKQKAFGREEYSEVTHFCQPWNSRPMEDKAHGLKMCHPYASNTCGGVSSRCA
jgi:hypothetical protein